VKIINLTIISEDYKVQFYPFSISLSLVKTLRIVSLSFHVNFLIIQPFTISPNTSHPNHYNNQINQTHPYILA